MDQCVTSLITGSVATVRADDTVETVASELHRNGLSFVPVVDGPGDTLLGIISANDILHFRASKRDPASARAWEICTYRPVEVGVDATVSDVARLMVERQIHHVVVMNNHTLVGIVSALDFVKEFIKPE